MSENSSARTWVTAEDSDEIISGNRSVMPPGWMPDPCSVTPPATAASATALTAGLLRSGYTQPTGVTTFFPDRRMATTSSSLGISGLYTTQSASRASTSSLLDVAATPSDSMPKISPTSRPFLSVLCTQQPASSSCGWFSTHPMAALPTPPVAHWMTRSFDGLV